MARQKALVIHNSELIKELLTQYLMSEFSNFKVVTTGKLSEVQQWLEETSFDLILCADMLREATALDIADVIKRSALNANAGVVVVSHVSNQQEVLLYQEHGLEHCILLPMSALEFSLRIQDVLFLRSNRKSTRYYISELQLEVEIGGGLVIGDVNNISQSSISCELEAKDLTLDFVNSQQITLLFPEEYESIYFEGIQCRLLQVKVVEREMDQSPKRFHVVWEFVQIPQSLQPQWNSLFELIEQDVRRLEEQASQ